jgi:hypothetical protein
MFRDLGRAVPAAIVTALMTMSGSPALAQNRVIHIPLSEHYYDQPPSVGGLLLGFTISGTKRMPKPYLEISLPSGWTGSLACLRLTSENGQYEGQGEFLVTEEMTGGFRKVDLTTSAYPESLSKLQIASVVLKGGCSRDRRPEAAVTVWNESAPDGYRELVLMINSMDASETYIIVEGGQKITCSDTGNRQFKTYDTVCRVPRSALRGGTAADFEINCRRSGSFDDPVTVRLNFPR